MVCLSVRISFINLKSVVGRFKLKFIKMFLTTPIILLSSAVVGVWGHARIDSPTPRLVSNIEAAIDIPVE